MRKEKGPRQKLDWIPGLQTTGDPARRMFGGPAFAGMTSLCIFLISSQGRAQGFLPPAVTSTATVSAAGPLLIGQTIPTALSGINEEGKPRSLLSYKSAIEVLVITFISPQCSDNQVPWTALRRLTDHFVGWRVAFLAVDAQSTEGASPLPGVLAREHLSWPVMRDPHRAAVNLLHVTGTPEVVIADEYGVLRYRGPISDVRDALDAIIGHLDPVKDPEPALTGVCPL